MIVIAKNDVLTGLKRCKRLAKQDILASQHTAEPDFWVKQAEGRRAVYTELMQLVEELGVDDAYRYAVKKYADLPFFVDNNVENAEQSGMNQAFEVFFLILGVQKPSKKEINLRASDSLMSNGNLAMRAHS